MPKAVWRDTLYVQAYQAAMLGLSNVGIAKAIKVKIDIFKYWLKTKPAFRDAIEEGRAKSGAAQLEAANGKPQLPWMDYVYQRLPENLQELWLKIVSINRGPTPEGLSEYKDAADRIERLFDKTGSMRARQELWIHALCVCQFNGSEACRLVNVSQTTILNWCKEPGFRELLKQIKVMKKDFAEGLMLKYASLGDASLIKRLNEALNADRGYNPVKKTKGTNEIVQKTYDVAAILDKIPLEERQKMLETQRMLDKHEKEPPKEVFEVGDTE